ncbi:MAG: MBL fold metallo-hydrolase [Candidatus Omnitrophota bacterium]
MNLEHKAAVVLRRFVVGPLQTNCYLFSDSFSKKGAIIDPGEYTPAITDYINESGIEMCCIINTHGHADHISGNAFFSLPVMIHKDDESFLKDSERNLSSFFDKQVHFAEASRILEDNDTINIGALELKVLHTPGHTPGSISLLSDNILFSGDTLFCEGIGRTDFPYGSFQLEIASIKNKLMVLPDDVKVYPGHGSETTIGHERKNNPYLNSR